MAIVSYKWNQGMSVYVDCLLNSAPMSHLSGKHILLGVTGGIAAYKSAELVRRLREQDAEVCVVMTAGAREFITPLTLQALSGQLVHTDLLDPGTEAAMDILNWRAGRMCCWSPRPRPILLRVG